MVTKLFEVRDRCTSIPCFAIEMRSTDPELTPAEYFLVRRAGYGVTLCVLFGTLQGGRQAEYDPYAWASRTFKYAHHYALENWDSLESGAVLDVEFILGETPTQKISERLA
jgi:hypothetical protein